MEKYSIEQVHVQAVIRGCILEDEASLLVGSQVADTLRAATHHAKVGRRHAAIAEEPLGDYLVEYQRTPKRARCRVWDTSHLEHGRNVGATAFALNPLRQVKDDSRRPALRIGWRESLEGSEQSFIASHSRVSWPPSCRACQDSFKCPADAVFLGTRLAELADHAPIIIVSNDSYPHDLLLVLPAVGSLTPIVPLYLANRWEQLIEPAAKWPAALLPELLLARHQSIVQRPSLESNRSSKLYVALLGRRWRPPSRRTHWISAIGVPT